MMIVVTLEAKPSERRTFLHEFKNFGEDVFRWLRDNGYGEVSFDEIDGPTGAFTIREVKASKVRRVVLWVETEARRQHLFVSVVQQK